MSEVEGYVQVHTPLGTLPLNTTSIRLLSQEIELWAERYEKDIKFWTRRYDDLSLVYSLLCNELRSARGEIVRLKEVKEQSDER